MKFTITYLAFFISLFSNGQEVWDLQKCIQHALEHNINVKQTEINAKLQYQNQVRAKGQRMPSINAYANHSYNIGQRIDPFTNQFANNSVRSNNFYMSTSIPLYNGMELKYGIEQARHDFASSQFRVEKTKNDIALAVASAYLNILFSQELVANSEQQVVVTRQQLDRMGKLVVAGVNPKGDLLQIEAQLSTEELTLITANNNLLLANLNLKQLLELEESTSIQIARPEINISDKEEVESTPGQVFQAALGVLPEVKQGQAQTKSAESGLKIAKAGTMPSLSLSASSGTGYSGASKEVTSVTQVADDVIGYTNEGVDVYAPAYDYTLNTKAFGDQVADNLNHSVALNLNIPILNGFNSKTNVEQARLNMELALLNEELTKNQVEKDIEQAHADAVAALKKYRATEKSVNALTESFTYAEQRFNIGLMNTVEYNDAKNKMIKSASDLLQAKYEYTFKVKILNFYQGRSLTL